MKQRSGAFDPDILAIVRELRMYRKAMGISVREMARRANIGTFALQRWEHEDRMPDMINLRIWAETLGYTIKVTIVS
jgi:transcriptional regulator with XRE-family HTH domain